MISIDTSICAKWFKPGERFEAEARDLRDRLERQEVEAAANEILSLEIVRGLKGLQARQPALGPTDAEIDTMFRAVEDMFRTGILLECPVAEVKEAAKELEISVGLFMADALHLATAIHLGADYFVADDHHLLHPAVVAYARGEGVQIVDLPGLIAALNALGGPGP